MKLTFLVVPAFAALSAPVYAADLASTIAPGAPASASSCWEGFFFGGHIGYAFGTSSYQTNPPGFPAVGAIDINGRDSQFGPLYGGLQGGYNYVTRSGILLGVEADFSFPDEMKGKLPIAFAASGPSEVNDNIEIFGALRGRIGYVHGNWLIYGTGGFAYDRDLATSTDAAGDVDKAHLWRPGWTAGAGVEVRLTPEWSAKLEYDYSDFARAGVTFPIAGARYQSDLSLQTVQLGLNYRFGGNSAPASEPKAGIFPNLNDWSIHAQSTLIGMGNAPFTAAYSGPNSLFPGYEGRDTISVDGFLGYRVLEGTEFYFNPEGFQGFGLSTTHGIGGFPNNEAQKGGFEYPYYETARLFLRQTFGLGGEQEDIPDGPLQVAEKVDVSRVTLTVGKFAVPDIFDNNTYAHDARTSFMNYAFVDGGAFDYAGNQPGFTWGSVVELNQKDWALRAGYFLLAAVPNSNIFDDRLFESGQYVLEFEDRFKLFGKPAKIRLTAWDSQCNCGSFAETLANPFLSNPALNPNAPDIVATRRTRSEFGFIGNFEQAVTDDLGLFARLSWRNGQTEIMQFTDIDESASFGGVLKGTAWGRPNDRVGLAGMINGLSSNYRAFLAAGGLGLIIGDGALSYRPEEIVETYYSIGLTDWASMTFDYQFVANPGYNDVRGPVSIGALRWHVQY